MSAICDHTVEFTHQSPAIDELFRQCECKDRFIAVTGHELRNLLAPIVTSLDVLIESADSESTADLVLVAKQHTQQLSRLIDDLIDASRLALGKVQLCRETLDLRSIVERSLHAVRPVTQQRNQQLLVTWCDSPLWLRADPLRLDQIVLNLLNNAVKFTPEGGCVWVQLRREENSAVFQVRDSGCGIRRELLPRIFDFFSQAETNGRFTKSGLGIGLAMVRSLVELHDGTVVAHSDGPGCGADFVVRLPLQSQ